MSKVEGLSSKGETLTSIPPKRVEMKNAPPDK